jgi:hypothetical protein
MSMLLSPTELSTIRETRSGFMPDRAVIYRYALAGDGMGGSSEAWTPAGTVDCYLWSRPVVDAEMVTGGQVTSRTRWYAELPYDATVTAKDWLEVGARTFTVVTVPNDASILAGLRVELIAMNEEQRRK